MTNCPYCDQPMLVRDMFDIDVMELEARWDGYEAARKGEPIQCGKTLGCSKNMLLQWESGWQIGQQARKLAGVKIA